MYWPMFNPVYYLFALPALILGMWAQFRVRSAYKKYQRVRNRSGLSGLAVAQRLLEFNGLRHVSVKETPGQLSDHYDPRSKALLLL